MQGPPRHHRQARPLDLVDAAREVAALERPVVDHREMQEDVVGQEEEVAQRVDERLAAPGVLQLVEIDDHPEHEHRRDHGDDPGRDRLGTGAGPRPEHGQARRPARRSVRRGSASGSGAAARTRSTAETASTPPEVDRPLTRTIPRIETATKSGFFQR